MLKGLLRSLMLCFGVMYGMVLQAQVTCPNPFDGNADGVVGIGDLLDLLGLFGDIDEDGDGTWDSVDLCTDSTACNFHAVPSETCAYLDFLGVCNGGCTGDSDGDGICDNIDTCIGVFDECGVCNGSGPTEVNIDGITVLYDSVYAAQVDTWFVYEVGMDTTFSYTCPPPPLPCGELMAFDGYDYATVQIGGQCWFAENLRAVHYANGDAISAGLSDSQWNSASFGATAVYGEDTGCNSESPDFDACDPAESSGGLWAAVQLVCRQRRPGFVSGGLACSHAFGMVGIDQSPRRYQHIRRGTEVVNRVERKR